MQRYILNIDWLTLYGSHSMALAKEAFLPEKLRQAAREERERRMHETAREDMQEECVEFLGCMQHYFGNIILDVQEYGTRQYNAMFHVYLGRELFGYLQAYPRVSTIEPDAFRLKIANYWLYQPDCWKQLAYVLGTLHLAPKAISRLDIAADFNTFEDDLHPLEFIRRFMAGEIKKKGRSEGQVYFEQSYSYSQKDARFKDTLCFNGLTIGKRTSDAHCYLYNKTKELKEQVKKPWIEECWSQAGLNCDDVWRLEVSLTSDALKLNDKETGETVHFGLANLTGQDTSMDMHRLYHIMVRSLFFFFYPTGQHNISREKMINLFGEEIDFSRSVLRGCNPSDRAERTLIKTLHVLRQRYRLVTVDEEHYARQMARKLAETMRLSEWYDEHKDYWRNEKLKV